MRDDTHDLLWSYLYCFLFLAFDVVILAGLTIVILAGLTIDVFCRRVKKRLTQMPQDASSTPSPPNPTFGRDGEATEDA